MLHLGHKEGVTAEQTVEHHCHVSGTKQRHLYTAENRFGMATVHRPIAPSHQVHNLRSCRMLMLAS